MGNQSEIFQRACIKTLSKSELFDQKEFNGVKALKPPFGKEARKIKATFSLRGQPETASVVLTWYDFRENNTHRSEAYRLYYEPNIVMAQAMPGGNIVIGYNRAGQLQCVLFKNHSVEHQGEHGSWSDYI